MEQKHAAQQDALLRPQPPPARQVTPPPLDTPHSLATPTPTHLLPPPTPPLATPYSLATPSESDLPSFLTIVLTLTTHHSLGTCIPLPLHPSTLARQSRAVTEGKGWSHPSSSQRPQKQQQQQQQQQRQQQQQQQQRQGCSPSDRTLS